MKATKLYPFLFIVVLAGVGLYSMGFFKKSKRKMLKKVADEGYETAIDVLYPAQHTLTRKLHYGPVIPS